MNGGRIEFDLPLSEYLEQVDYSEEKVQVEEEKCRSDVVAIGGKTVDKSRGKSLEIRTSASQKPQTEDLPLHVGLYQFFKKYYGVRWLLASQLSMLFFLLATVSNDYALVYWA